MKHLAIITLSFILIGCAGHKPDTSDTQADKANALATTADSTAYFLGLSLAERIRSSLADMPKEKLEALDFNLFNSGVAGLLSAPTDKPGIHYGTTHAAIIQHQLALIRETAIPISNRLIVRGFADAINADTADTTARAHLDRLMVPVNSRLITIKLRKNAAAHPRPPKNPF